VKILTAILRSHSLGPVLYQRSAEAHVALRTDNVTVATHALAFPHDDLGHSKFPPSLCFLGFVLCFLVFANSLAMHAGPVALEIEIRCVTDARSLSR
jgi:hypothetical protein